VEWSQQWFIEPFLTALRSGDAHLIMGQLIPRISNRPFHGWSFRASNQNTIQVKPWVHSSQWFIASGALRNERPSVECLIVSTEVKIPSTFSERFLSWLTKITKSKVPGTAIEEISSASNYSIPLRAVWPWKVDGRRNAGIALERLCRKILAGPNFHTLLQAKTFYISFVVNSRDIEKQPPIKVTKDFSEQLRSCCRKSATSNKINECLNCWIKHQPIDL